LRFENLEEALAFLRRTMDVPVRLPAHLPTGLRLDPYDGLFVRTMDGPGRRLRDQRYVLQARDLGAGRFDAACAGVPPDAERRLLTRGLLALSPSGRTGFTRGRR
jgi:hypothetical protein